MVLFWPGICYHALTRWKAAALGHDSIQSCSCTVSTLMTKPAAEQMEQLACSITTLTTLAPQQGPHCSLPRVIPIFLKYTDQAWQVFPQCGRGVLSNLPKTQHPSARHAVTLVRQVLAQLCSVAKKPKGSCTSSQKGGSSSLPVVQLLDNDEDYILGTVILKKRSLAS